MNAIEKKVFAVPTRAEVSANNQVLFDNLQKGIGFVQTYMPILQKTKQH